jgi:TetR/AcrR family transcriptional regulator
MPCTKDLRGTALARLSDGLIELSMHITRTQFGRLTVSSTIRVDAVSPLTQRKSVGRQQQAAPTGSRMSQQRDLNRTRERILAAAHKEFAESGFAGTRTDAIARRAHVNERMIFYCFGSKEKLYRAVLGQKLAAATSLVEANGEDDFVSGLVKGFAANCASTDGIRMWQWEALDHRRRKLVAEEERRAYFHAAVARLRRAKLAGALPQDANEEMVLLVSAALRAFPLAFPQVTSLVTGLDPLDFEFQRKWTACLEWIAGRLIAPAPTGGDGSERDTADASAVQSKAAIKTRQPPDATRRSKRGVNADQ